MSAELVKRTDPWKYDYKGLSIAVQNDNNQRFNNLERYVDFSIRHFNQSGLEKYLGKPPSDVCSH